MKTNNFKLKFSKLLVITSIVSFLFVSLFYTVLISLAFSKPLCCADDSYISVAAKNFALGSGYGTSLASSKYGIKKFEPGITTGPTVVIPAAIMIKFFGNSAWIPGLTSVLINLILTIIIYFLSYKFFDLIKANIFISIFLLFCFSFLYPNWILLWHSLIGEVPASLYYLVGIMLFSYREQKENFFLLSIFILGLSFLTKLLYLIPIIPFITYAFSKYYFQKINLGLKITKSLTIVLVFFLPSIIFEFAKFIDIGVDNYFNSFKEIVVNYLNMHGSIDDNFSGVLYRARADIIKNDLGLSLLSILSCAFFYLLFIFFIKMDYDSRKMIILTFIGFILSFIWWFFLSKGWIRYAFPWLFIFIFMSTFFIIKVNKILLKIIIFVFIIIFINPIEFKNDIRLLKEYQWYFYEKNERINNLISTKEFLIKNQQFSPFISSWWATYADIEYILPAAYNFKRFNEIDSFDTRKKILVVRNLDWVQFNRVIEFEKFVERFNDTVFYAHPYLITSDSTHFITSQDTQKK